MTPPHPQKPPFRGILNILNIFHKKLRLYWIFNRAKVV
jgi:hypothetical protein